MKNLSFDDYEDFAYAVAEEYEKIRGNDILEAVEIVGKYAEIKEIMETLVNFGYGLASIRDFSEPDWAGYDDEYLLSLYEGDIWCEPARRDGEYISSASQIAYILDNCSSKVLPYIESDEMYEVAICDFNEDECDGDCENCKDAIYKVNGKEVSENEYYDELAKYDELDSLIDEYNERIELLESLYRLFGV